MKRVFLLLMLFCASIVAVAQTPSTLSGMVQDKATGVPLPYATVAVMRADSSVHTGTVTDEKGLYQVVIDPCGEYLLAVSFIGYSTHYQHIRVAEGGLTLPTIVLEADDRMLQAVHVVAKAPIIEQQVDKLVMNVSQSAFAAGNTAMDLLRKAPGVSVDKDGNVQLNGQAVSVWIDGRPSQLDGKSLEMLLRGTDGTNIDKIEIISNPSAKYDAAGQGGIINIKTKRNFAQGLNGSVSFDVGAMAFNRQVSDLLPRKEMMWDQSFNANVSYRTDKTNTFVQLSEQTEQMGVDYFNKMVSNINGHQIRQESGTMFNVDNSAFNFKIGNDWFIDKKNTLGVIFTMPISGMMQENDTNANHSFQTLDDVLVQQTLSHTVTDYDIRQYMGNINFTHVFDEAKSSELTANLDYFHNVTNTSNLQDNYYLPLLSPVAWVAALADSNKVLNLNSDNIIDIFSAKVDWQSVVLGKYMMEAGAKWALSKTDNMLTQLSSTQYRNDDSVYCSELNSPFDYTEHVGALYATMARQFTAQWTAKVGLRGEYTYAYNSDNTVKQNYFNLFPTVFVGYNTPDYMTRINVSYTRRIQRPNYTMLNPFRNYVDAHTCNVGNPDLKPSFSDNVYLSAGFGRYVTLYLNSVILKDVITTIPYLDPVAGEQMMVHDNFGSQTLLGGGMTITELPLSKSLSLMVNLGAYDMHSADVQGGRVLGTTTPLDTVDVHSFFGSLYGCLTWNLPKSWKIQFDGWCSSPIRTGYLSIGWNGGVDLGVKKTALDGRLVFSLNVNDIFRTMRNDFSMDFGSDIVSTFSQHYLWQKLKVGLVWNFGAAQKPLKHRKVGELDELGRTGSSNSLSGTENSVR